MSGGGPLRPDEIEAIRTWLAAGMSGSEIAVLLGRSHDTVYEAVRRHGMVGVSTEARSRIKAERIKLRLARTAPPIASTPAMPASKVRALYAGRKYRDDLRAAQPEPLWRGPAPVRVYDGGMSSSGWLVLS